ncbi:response regulator transcription factor [Actinoplanes sp. NPDC051343]|uniref:response regulator transcription factor n=1 Tax=Actinoplanes sp. NPDC051343 TaxID=3363906 RepID=UPI0037AA2DE4
MTPIRVVVVDDQPLVRMGVRALPAVEPDTELVGEATDGRAGIELIRRSGPDVALIDIQSGLGPS